MPGMWVSSDLRRIAIVAERLTSLRLRFFQIIHRLGAQITRYRGGGRVSVKMCFQQARKDFAIGPISIILKSLPRLA